MTRSLIVVDGNEACASIAHRVSEVISIYPITPASPMGELADAWSSQGRTNIFGTVPAVVAMQSEGGAAGAVHGALQAGALTTTFTASQGLLLMIPNMFKIAGELTCGVIHVAARSIATHALSIFGDHSDVMAARSTGWTMLCSGSVQEAHDFALISHAATLRSRVPVLHFFDGFRTSHEINRIQELNDDDLRAFISPELIRAHRDRALDPDHPVLRGTAQNPDVFFQAREAANPFYDATPAIIQEAMDKLADRVGRRYGLFDYVGDPNAERVIVLMGSGAGPVRETVRALTDQGESVGLLIVRLYRPFDVDAFVAKLPPTTRRIAVLDRTKEPGSVGEPLYQDVVTAIAERWRARHRGSDVPDVIGGRYGLSSKEFNPAMVAAIYAELDREEPKRHFTVGIYDDVTGLSLDVDREFRTDRSDDIRAVFFGLGSDGTVGANKNAAKIIGEHTDLHAQGYFVYDSKKAGAVTISHLRFSREPICASYLIERANFVACHQFHLLDKMDVLGSAQVGATLLLNSPWPTETLWDHLSAEVQRQIIEKQLDVYVVDAHAVAGEAGLGGRINTVMQTCFFAISGILPREDALAYVRDAIQHTYGRRGESVVRENLQAVDRAIGAMHRFDVPTEVRSDRRRPPPVPESAPDFVTRITGMMIAGRGDLLPVSAMPADGTFPVGTARFEKRGIAREIPIWDPDICIDCGLCALVCPHAAIRTKVYEPSSLDGAPDGFRSKACKGKEFAGRNITIQVAPDDCTGCGVCVDVCPAHSKEVVRHKAINMTPKGDHLDRERASFEHFLSITPPRREDVKLTTIKGSQLVDPLFEFSGACAGCGETPYLKLLTQLFGDRMLVANATGCSSIYGANLPTTPWTCDADGRGPSWSNSLFEDNAEFGLGMRLAVEQKAAHARHLLTRLAQDVGQELADELLAVGPETDADLRTKRTAVDQLRSRLRTIDRPEAYELDGVAEALVPRSVWIIGGDGWAYDIGFGGLDHVLATGRNVNMLVLDTEVYSNTGGQASKSTPRAAVAKFAAGGKQIGKKNLGLLAMDYGNAYVAQIAMGANPQQTIRAMIEAESYNGPSLIIAYSHCIAHGIEMSTAMHHQKEAVDTGYWPLFRFDPRHAHTGDHPLRVDCRKPSKPFREFALKEARFALLTRTNPDQAEHLLSLAQDDIDERWRLFEQLADVERSVPEMEGAV